jgi:putative ABC transport system permease protein
MIQIKNLNKNFTTSKQKSTPILKNVNLTLDNLGFVMIVGASGAGKTTLLNCLCGMDKASSGEIQVDNYTFTKYHYNRWDNLRNHEFGFIFQNYELFNDKSVEENIAITLEMLGIRDKAYIKQRVSEVLAVVDMAEYQNRLISTLSGGQMQRVSIARALVKNPKYIIADEPTGNLDEKNSILILELLQKISEQRLVVMVTHDIDFAKFYATRIITLKDGEVINDEVNLEKGSSLKLEENQNLYLLDMEKTEENIATGKITGYKTNQDAIVNLNLRYAVRGNTIYLEAASLTHSVKLLDAKSGIQMLESHKKEFLHQDDHVSNAKLSELDQTKKSKHTNMTFGSYLRESFVELHQLKGIKRNFLYGFFFISLLILVMTPLYYGTSHPERASYQTTDSHFVAVDKLKDDGSSFDYDVMMSLLSDDVSYYPCLTNDLRLTTEKYAISNPVDLEKSLSNRISFIPYTSVENYQGEVPNPGEVVLDEMVANALLGKGYFQGTSYDLSQFLPTKKLLMSQKIYLNSDTYTLKGTSKNNNLAIYCNPVDQYDIYRGPSGIHFKSIDKMVGFSNNNDSITSLEELECLLPSSWMNLYPVGSTYSITYSMVAMDIIQLDLKVVGYYDVQTYSYKDQIIVNDDMIRETNFNSTIGTYMNFFSSQMGFYLYAKNPTEFCKTAKLDGVRAVSLLEQDRTSYQNSNQITYKILNWIVYGLFLIPLVFLLFYMRSRLIAKRRYIMIYRGLGMKRSQFIKMMLAQVFSIFLVSSLPGCLVGTILCIILRNNYAVMVSMNAVLFLVLYFAIFGINLFVGLLPSFAYFGKTPREMMSQYDI